MAKKKKGSAGRVILLAIVLLGLLAAYKVFGPNTENFPEGSYLYLHTGSDYAALTKALKDGGFVSDMFSFDLVAKARKLPAHVHAGKYKIERGMSNFNIVRMLRNGRQTPVKLVIHKLRTKQDLVNIICTNLEADSAALKQMLHDQEFLSQFGLDTNTAMCAILPDTYDFYWNSTADKAFRKIARNYTHFWDDTRKQEAKNQGLTPVKAMIVASIVDEETNMAADKPKVASVYLNRLDKGMKLQADPTVRFAVGDFTIKRVTGQMLGVNSPYNTYLNEGLPPGPICTPAPSSIDAVLTAPKTTYMFFCAKEDFSGYSNFASTYDEQVKNARAYQQALDARGIH